MSKYLEEFLYEGKKGKVTQINKDLCFFIINSDDNDHKVYYSDNKELCLGAYNDNNSCPLNIDDEVFFVFNGIDEIDNKIKYSVNKKSKFKIGLVVVLFLIIICSLIYFVFKSYFEHINRNDQVSDI